MNEIFESTVSKMGRKRIINVPAKSKIKIGKKVKIEELKWNQYMFQ